MVENGGPPDLLLHSECGHRIHVWNLRTRKVVERLDLGKENQMELELRPAHDPSKTYGFVVVVISVTDLFALLWRARQR